MVESYLIYQPFTPFVTCTFDHLQTGHRLNNFYVAVGSNFHKDTFNPDGYGEICKFMPGARSDGEIIDVICDQSMYGRYVTIFMKTIEHMLQLCEVEVMGSIGESISYN